MNCPQCDTEVNRMPANPMWGWPDFTMGMDAGGTSATDTFATTTVSTTQVETKRTYKCVNPKCWVTKIRIEWE